MPYSKHAVQLTGWLETQTAGFKEVQTKDGRKDLGITLNTNLTWQWRIEPMCVSVKHKNSNGTCLTEHCGTYCSDWAHRSPASTAPYWTPDCPTPAGGGQGIDTARRGRMEFLIIILVWVCVCVCVRASMCARYEPGYYSGTTTHEYLSVSPSGGVSVGISSLSRATTRKQHSAR